MIEQTEFLGASVTGFNCNLGWGESVSTLGVDLVEDLRAEQSFINPSVGAPTLFNFNGWLFGGIIQSWEKKISTGGSPIYSVHIEDPREVLNGCHIILNGYTGTVNLPNLINVYGYLENLSFGSSGRNEGGIKASKIRSAIISLTNGADPSYGGLIKILGNSYKLDLSNLPTMPDYYRIPNDSISVLDFVRTVCDDANHDFFFTLDFSGTGYIIKLQVVNKNFESRTGIITRFVETTDGAEVKNLGFEYANDITSKFLVGGNILRLYGQTQDGGEDGDISTNPWDNSIWPYWGLQSNDSLNGDVIIGEGIGNDHQFTLDISHLGIDSFADFNHQYTTDVGELRAALVDMDSWLTYLQLRNNNQYKIDFSGSNLYTYKHTYRPFNDIVRVHLTPENGNTVTSVPIIENSNHYHKLISDAEARNITVEVFAPEYKGNGIRNPHFGKSDRLEHFGNIIGRYAGIFLYNEIENSNSVNAQDLDLLKNIQYNTNTVITSAFRQEKQDRLYTYIRGIAETYYGKQFMVRVPFVSSVSQPETGAIYTTYKPKSEGFLTESEYPNAIANNLVPIQFIDGDPDKGFLVDPRFVSEEGLITAYVRFDGISSYDYSDIPSQDIIVNEIYNSVFIRCTVLDYFVYQDKDTLYSPRAVVQLPGRVLHYKGSLTPWGYSIIGEFLYPSYNDKNAQGADSLVSNLIYGAGSDLLQLGSDNEAVSPDLVVIGLESNQRYGPWTSQGVDGKVEYEQDDTLVPWNYRSWTELNNAANAKIQEALSLYQVNENGTVTFPGVPERQLGTQLLAGGPIVTNISVDIGTGGVKTTYNMNTWKHHPYKLNKHRNDAISRISKRTRDIQRNFTALKSRVPEQSKEALKLQRELAQLKKPAHMGIHSSHEVMVSDGTNVYFQPTYNTIHQLENIEAVASFDSLFFPFNIEDLETIDEEYENIVPNGDSLNPYKEGGQFRTLSSEDNYNPSDPNFDWEKVQGMALRLPMMGIGYGYDLAGNPVPHADQPLDEDDNPIDDGGEYLKTFHDDYQDPENWTVAPMDWRYDPVRKVWTTGTSILVEVVNIGTTAKAGPNKIKCKRVLISEEDEETEETVKVLTFNKVGEEFDVINFRENFAISGHKYIAHSMDGYYVLDVQHTFLDFE